VYVLLGAVSFAALSASWACHTEQQASAAAEQVAVSCRGAEAVLVFESARPHMQKQIMLWHDTCLGYEALFKEYAPTTRAGEVEQVHLLRLAACMAQQLT
jgi:hypothetical protein